jgi:hypothetical protein
MGIDTSRVKLASTLEEHSLLYLKRAAACISFRIGLYLEMISMGNLIIYGNVYTMSG